MISFYIIVSIFMVNCAFNNLSVCFNLYINIFNFITLTPSTAACTLLLLCLSFFKSLSYFQHDPFIMYYHHYSSVLIFKRSWTLRLEAFYFTRVWSGPQPCLVVPPNCTDVSLRFTCGWKAQSLTRFHQKCPYFPLSL